MPFSKFYNWIFLDTPLLIFYMNVNKPIAQGLCWKTLFGITSLWIYVFHLFDGNILHLNRNLIELGIWLKEYTYNCNTLWSPEAEFLAWQQSLQCDRNIRTMKGKQGTLPLLPAPFLRITQPLSQPASLQRGLEGYKTLCLLYNVQLIGLETKYTQSVKSRMLVFKRQILTIFLLAFFFWSLL